MLLKADNVDSGYTSGLSVRLPSGPVWFCSLILGPWMACPRLRQSDTEAVACERCLWIEPCRCLQMWLCNIYATGWWGSILWLMAHCLPGPVEFVYLYLIHCDVCPRLRQSDTEAIALVWCRWMDATRYLPDVINAWIVLPGDEGLALECVSEFSLFYY